jgi:ribosomal-protein-alanine N-acetyltransferase
MSDFAGSVGIVRVATGHAAELARVYSSLFDAAWDAASFREMLGSSGAVAFAARVVNPREMVGFIIGRVAADEAEILAVGVVGKWQRLGIGRRLVEALALAASQGGARHLYLEVAAGNIAARSLYHRLGFAESGRRQGYYARAGAPAEDAINLWLPLERAPVRGLGGRQRARHL